MKRIPRSHPSTVMVPHYTMDPNTGYPAGYPVPTQSPQNQQMPFYPNAVPQYPQSKTPSAQQFGAMPMQPGPGGAMMPSGFPQQSSGSLPPLPPLFFFRYYHWHGASVTFTPAWQACCSNFWAKSGGCPTRLKIGLNYFHSSPPNACVTRP